MVGASAPPEGRRAAPGHRPASLGGGNAVDHFDKNMALDMIEDALEAQSNPIGRGIAAGLCSAFYLCGVIDSAEWEGFQKRILAEHGANAD